MSLCQLGLCFSFPDSSAGKESTCNTGDPSSIPGSGRSAGEGIGYPLQYSWASLVANLVMNLPAMWETWVPSLGWEDLLEKGKAAHSSILAWRIPWTLDHNRVSKSWTWLRNLHFHLLYFSGTNIYDDLCVLPESAIDIFIALFLWPEEGRKSLPLIFCLDGLATIGR